MFNVKDFLINGKVRSFTSIGSYPLLYWNKKGEIICPCCADEDKEGVEGAGVNWETEMFCDLCSSQIESAY